jgi:type 1 fimbria pilin
MGTAAAGSAAAIGTGAFEGAYVNAERSLSVNTTDDSAAILGLVATSPYASYESNSGTGGAEGGDLSADMLQVNLDNLNTEADTRLDDVFRVRNNSGSEINLLVSDTTNWDNDVVQIWAQPTDNGTDVGNAVRLDDGGDITIGVGEEVEINILVLLGTYDPNGSPYNMSLEFTADGTDS